MARLNSALVVVLVATSALAQTTTTQVVTQPLIIRTQTSDFQDEIPFGPGECDSTFTVRWKYTSSLGTACSEVAFWSTTATSCGDAPLSSDKTYPSVSQAVLLISPSGNFNLKVAELPGFKTQTLEDGGVRAAATCGELNKETQHLVCGSANAGSFGTCGTFGGTTVTKLKASPLKLKYDTLPPAAPSITEAVATNGAATLSFSPNADAAYVVPIVTELLDGGQGGPVERAEVANENGKVRITGLTNGVTYRLQLRFIDAAKNVGPESAAVEVTPVRTFGFWGAYKDAGGTDQGGCSVSWGLMPMLAVLWFMIRRASR